MSVNLKKGQKVSLTKESAGLTKVIVGLGWDEADQKRSFFSSQPQPIDCDASAILLTNGRIAANSDIVYYNALRHPSGSVVHQGDNLTGAGEGDDEQIIVDLANVPPKYDRIIFAVNIYKAYERSQQFGMINNAFIRLVDARNGSEICRYNLSDNYNGMTAMIFGEIYRHEGEWKFNAIGQATRDASLTETVKRYV